MAAHLVHEDHNDRQFSQYLERGSCFGEDVLEGGRGGGREGGRE